LLGGELHCVNLQGLVKVFLATFYYVDVLCLDYILYITKTRTRMARLPTAIGWAAADGSGSAAGSMGAGSEEAIEASMLSIRRWISGASPPAARMTRRCGAEV
jgi:hypothetical protein